MASKTPTTKPEVQPPPTAVPPVRAEQAQDAAAPSPLVLVLHLVVLMLKAVLK